MKRIVVGLVALVMLVGLAAPAGAYHSKVSLARTVKFDEGWWHTHVRISHWEPNQFVATFLCNPGYEQGSVDECRDLGALYTDADGRAKFRISLVAGAVGKGECNDEFEGCTIVVISQNGRTSRYFYRTAVAAPIVPPAS